MPLINVVAKQRRRFGWWGGWVVTRPCLGQTRSSSATCAGPICRQGTSRLRSESGSMRCGLPREDEAAVCKAFGLPLPA